MGLACLALGLGVSAVVSKCSSPGQLPAAVVATFPSLVELLTATIGLIFMVRFWPARQGLGLHCKECNYYQERRGRLAAACPECGATWLWIGNTRRGRPTGEVSLVLLGLGLCVLALAGRAVRTAKPFIYLRFLPTRILCTQVSVLPDDSTAELWGEIARRKLPAATLDALAEPLLQKKARDGYLSLAAEMVVFDAMMRPTAPAASVARYFASFLSATLDAPTRTAQDQPVVHRARAEFRGHRLTLGAVPRVLVISALYAGDNPEPVQVWTWEVDPESSATQQRMMGGHLSAAEPGVLRLRQSFWLAVGPTNAGTVTWEHGQPVVPAVMTIKDQFDEVCTVQVDPAPAGPGSVPAR